MPLRTSTSSTRLKVWASLLEDATFEQARATSGMPFVFPHVALMPDAHLGKGATVGSVIPTLGAVMPAAVGVDIGCGMIAHRLDVRLGDVAGLDRRALRESVEAAVPLSAGHYNTDLYDDGTRGRIAELETAAENHGVDPDRYAGTWRLQLGTLGSGNHFIEVSVDAEERLWLFLHSGSRGVGNKIATHHIKVAQQQCERRWISLPDRDLAYLVEGDAEFWTYIRELRWAQEFARLNRVEMMARLTDCFEQWVGARVETIEAVNCHHNYTEHEKHFGKQVWLSRKGAISARAGEPGLIPGSMGTRSYVVSGLGNPVALHSAPTARDGSTPGRGRARPSPSTTCGRPWATSSTATRTRSSTRSPRRTRTSTRSWPTLPTWSRSVTPCGRSSTSRATEPRGGCAMEWIRQALTDDELAGFVPFANRKPGRRTPT